MIEFTPGLELDAEELRALEVFQGLDDAQLLWLREHAEAMHAAKGDHVIRVNEPADAMYVLLEGALQFRLNVSGQPVHFVVDKKGDVGGALPYSRALVNNADAVAITDLRGMRLPKLHFPELLVRIPVMGQRLVSIMSDRVRDHTRLTQQREKMMALGKVAAGLAHELNNPASAARRAAAQIKERIAGLGRLAPKLVALRMDPAVVQEVVAFREAVLARPAVHIDAVRRSEAEDVLSDWLESRGAAESWQIAGSLADAGVTLDDLKKLAAGVPEEALVPAAMWLEASISASKLADELLAATGRISDLVASVKAYSHMDRAGDLVATDVREGIEGTLLILGHKLKHKSIQVERVYEPDPPKVQAYPGELNQVWTNLIDNAVDAMKPGGLLRLMLRTEHDCLRVCVCDDGDGIPEDIQSRIFDPFFTTKPVGEGTGVGLDVVHRIVTVQHRGDIEVESKPGKTVFSVWLPLKDERFAPPSPG